MSKQKVVDLHIHTDECDGATKYEVVTEARKHGICAVAAVDHQIVDGIDKLVEAARMRDVELEVISGVEISTLEGFDILGYLMDHHDPTLNRELARIREGRRKRARKRAERVHQYFSKDKIFFSDEGMTAEKLFDDVMKLTTNGNIAGGHFELHIYNQFRELAEKDPQTFYETMDALIKRIKSKNTGNEEAEHLAFDKRWDIHADYCVKFIKETLVRKYLHSKDMPCYVPRTEEDCLSAKDARELIYGAKGIGGPAHPGSTKKDGSLATIIALGFDVLECFSSKHSGDDNGKYAGMARDVGLVPTGGSDWHGKKFTPHIEIGNAGPIAIMGSGQVSNEIPYIMVENLRRRKKKVHGC